MVTRTRTELLEDVLTRASEQVEDLTGPAMERLYQQYPQIRESFEYHGAGLRGQLEAQMVETSLYCLMTWLDGEEEVVEMLHDSVRHHQLVLDIPPDWYRALLGAVIDVIVEHVPPPENEGAAVVEDIRTGLYGVIENTAAAMK